MTVVKFYKNPLAVLDYSLDWSDFLTDGDVLVASTWTASDAGITIASSAFTSTIATVWVSGGTVNLEYTLVNHITTQLGRQDYRAISIFIEEEPNELSDLIRILRLHLGDTDSSAYRYMDEWLLVALESSIKALQRWWGNKYIFDTTGNYVLRNPDYLDFSADSPPEIQDRDIRPIILMASILVKSGQLEANSWNVGSWKDAEVAVSNIESSRSKQFGMGLDWEELQWYLKPPGKQLWGAARISIPDAEE